MDVKPTDKRDTGSRLPNQGPAKGVPPDQPAGGWGGWPHSSSGVRGEEAELTMNRRRLLSTRSVCIHLCLNYISLLTRQYDT